VGDPLVSGNADRLLAERELVLVSHDVDVFGVGSNPTGKHVGLDLSNAADRENIEVGLVEAGTRRALAQLLGAGAMIDITDWIRVADRVGVPRKRIAELAGVSRPTVYAIIGTTEGHEDEGQAADGAR
jgi:hypothetical protein